MDAYKQEFSTKTIIKVVDNDQILAAGQVKYEGTSCFIGRMAVWPEHQGKGIGSKLMTSLENVFPEAKRIELFTGEKSHDNLNMYYRRGYREFKREMLGKTQVVFLEKFVFPQPKR